MYGSVLASVVLWVVLVVTMSVSADEVIGVTRSSLAARDRVNVVADLERQGYAVFTNSYFDGTVLWRRGGANRYLVVDVHLVPEGGETNTVLKLVDAQTTLILRSITIGSQHAGGAWLESVGGNDSGGKSMPRLTCGVGGYTHLSPHNQRLASEVERSMEQDGDIALVDGPTMRHVIQLQDMLASGGGPTHAMIAGRIQPARALVRFSEGAQGTLVAKVYDTLEGETLFRVEVPDRSQIQALLQRMKSSVPLPPATETR